MEMTSTEIPKVKLDADGLITAICQDSASGKVLMVAHMSPESIQQTLKSGEMVFYSRSRQEIWHKGETSGSYLHVESAQVDCDGDVLLASVEQTGAACHTGRRDCFFWKLDNDTARIDKSPLVDPKDLYDH